MLPDRLIPYREHEGHLHPLWLGARDEVWLREMVDEIDACSGATSDEADARVLEATFRLARVHGVNRRVVEAVWHVERRRYTTRVDAPISPERIRRVLFDLTADRSHEEAVATAASELGVTAASMLSALFADRSGARRLVPAATPPTTRTLLDGYHRALAEAIVVRTSEIVATVRAHTRRVVGAARLLGLMMRAERDVGCEGATRLVVSGPLALFHETVKYGRALASWLHTVATTPAWVVVGTTRVGGQALRFRLDAGAPIPRVHALGRATDSALEARLARDLRREAPRVAVAREGDVLEIGHRLNFPDFALTFPEGRVLVEVVGFWTPEYLASKAALAAEAHVPLVLCVDERHAHGPLAPREGIVPFRKVIDVSALLAACEGALARAREGSAVTTRPPRLRHRLRFAPTSTFARHAVGAGATPSAWPRELFDDLTRGGSLRAIALEAHPVYGPQILLLGERFVARAGRDRLAADTLFVNAVYAREAAAHLAARSAAVGADVELSLAAPPPGQPLRDDVNALLDRLLARADVARSWPDTDEADPARRRRRAHGSGRDEPTIAEHAQVRE